MEIIFIINERIVEQYEKKNQEQLKRYRKNFRGENDIIARVYYIFSIINDIRDTVEQINQRNIMSDLYFIKNEISFFFFSLSSFQQL